MDQQQQPPKPKPRRQTPANYKDPPLPTGSWSGQSRMTAYNNNNSPVNHHFNHSYLVKHSSPINRDNRSYQWLVFHSCQTLLFSISTDFPFLAQRQ